MSYAVQVYSRHRYLYHCQIHVKDDIEKEKECGWFVRSGIEDEKKTDRVDDVEEVLEKSKENEV